MSSPMAGGIYLIDKPKGFTSFDCDKIVRRATGIKKVGHSGTLDPFATGLLPVFAGDALKLMRYTDDYDKTYRCTAVFGFTSDTGDSDGVITPVRLPSEGDIPAIRAALAEIATRTTQIPPKYSAKKINGVKAYDLARQGVDFELKPAEIKIYSLDIESALAVDNGVEVTFVCHCSKGTYIRTICTDAGDLCGFGAYAKELRRIKAGPFDVADSVPASEVSADTVPTDPMRAIAHIPCVEVSEKNYEDIKCGRRFRAEKIEGFEAAPGQLVRAMYDGALIAIIYADETGIIRIDRGFAS